MQEMMRVSQASKPLFIVLEGGDGTGKSTIAQALCDSFIANKQKAICTREPGGTPLGLELRRLLLQDGDLYSQEVQLLMLNAARLAHWQHVIHPALQSGAHVVCDRFVDSTRVYQGLIQPHSEEALAHVNALHQQFLADAKPDIVLILDIDPAESMRRIQARGGEMNYLDVKPLSFHTAVRDGFRTLASQGHPYHLIPAGGSVEEVLQGCRAVVPGLN